MKKRLFAGFLILCVLLLCACHGSREKSAFSMPDSFDTSRNFEISFWAKNDTNKTQSEIYQKAIEDFHALYPNITVNIRTYTDYSKIYNDVITNIATDTTPNVCITYPDHIATYLTGTNVVAQLDLLMDDPKYGLGGSEVRFDSPTKEEIVPEYLQECTFSGYTYAMPFMRSTEACYVNKTMVEALGYTLPDVLTWDFMWEVAEKATEKDESGLYKINGQNVMIPIIYKSTDNMMIQMLKQYNVGYSTDAGEIEIFNDTTKSLLLTIAQHVKTGAFSTFKISSYPANFLNAGQCIFAIDSTAGSTWMGADAPLSDISSDKIIPFEIEVMTVPQADANNIQMISQGPSVCIFNKSDSQEVLASWLFVQYLLSDEVQIAYAQTEGYTPVTEKARENAEYLEYLSDTSGDADHYSVKLAATKLLLENTENTFVTPVFNGSASLRSAAGQLIEDTTKSVRRKTTVDESYIDNLFDDVTSLYRLDQIESETSASDSHDLGPLPQASAMLLGGLAAVWIAILGYVIFTVVRRKNRAN